MSGFEGCALLGSAGKFTAKKASVGLHVLMPHLCLPKWIPSASTAAHDLGALASQVPAEGGGRRQRDKGGQSAGLCCFARGKAMKVP